MVIAIDETATSNECVQYKIPIIKKEHPDWDDKQVIAVAYAYCQEHGTRYKDESKAPDLDTCVEEEIRILNKEHPQWAEEWIRSVAYARCGKKPFLHLTEKKKISPAVQGDSYLRILRDLYQKTNVKQDSFLSFVRKYTTLETAQSQSQDEGCYRDSNITETETEYIIPTVLAKAMVQPYGDSWMAKLPEDLERVLLMDYKTGHIVNRIPLFEMHPLIEIPELEVGFIDDIKYQPDKERIIGRSHVFKDKITQNLDGFFKRGEHVGVSVGFAYERGPGGVFRGMKYDNAQRRIMLTHLALLPPNEALGRCPLPFCGTGVDEASPEYRQMKRQIEQNTKTINDLIRTLKQHFILIAQRIG